VPHPFVFFLAKGWKAIYLSEAGAGWLAGAAAGWAASVSGACASAVESALSDGAWLLAVLCGWKAPGADAEGLEAELLTGNAPASGCWLIEEVWLWPPIT
jgi:hypothetical protein